MIFFNTADDTWTTRSIVKYISERLGKYHTRYLTILVTAILVANNISYKNHYEISDFTQIYSLFEGNHHKMPCITQATPV